MAPNTPRVLGTVGTDFRGLFSSLLLLLLLTSAFSNRNGIDATGSNTGCSNQSVVLVSFDGFRWDYFSRERTPYLHQIAAGGARVVQVKNAFITKTFPNHYTLVTGLFPESHGIVANAMYDPVWKEYFNESNTEGKWWDEAEPIWVTLRKRGLITATFNYPGSDVSIRGFYPNMYVNYSRDIPFEERAETVVRWLQMNPRPRFVGLYFEEPDSTGHKFGPESDETMEAAGRVDKIAGLLMDKLAKANLTNEVNVIFTSDHGMAQLSEEREIYLQDYIKSSSFELIDGSPVAAIRPLQNYEEQIFQNLSGCHPNLTVFKKSEVLERWHYSRNRRIMPIVAVVDEGWSIYMNRSEAAAKRSKLKGNHGYDNNLASMHPFFVAAGPAFVQNVSIPLIDNVDIYPLMHYILQTEPLPSNGTLRRVSRLLRPALRENCLRESENPDGESNHDSNVQSSPPTSWKIPLLVLLLATSALLLMFHLSG